MEPASAADAGLRSAPQPARCSEPLPEQKKKYATIEQRIAGGRQIAAQATPTDQSQIAASQAQPAVVDAQLNDLSRTRADVAAARDRTTTMLAVLQNQRSRLESQRKQLETSVKNQQDFWACYDKVKRPGLAE